MNTIDLKPLLDVLIQFGALILTGVLAWAVKRAADYFHVAKDSELRTVVSGAIDNGIAFAVAKAKDAEARGATIHTKDQMIANAANYVLPKVPDALAKLGVTPDHLAEIITAKLPA